MKKIVRRHKSQKKKFVENVGRKKKFVVEIDEKYVDQKKHQLVTYIIGKVYDKIFFRRNIKKNCRTLIAKKKFASNKNSSPPSPRYLMVRPLESVTLQLGPTSHAQLICYKQH